MFELRKITENTWYIECPSRIGIYRSENDGVWLVDSGFDENAGIKTLEILTENGFELYGIINTHSHADHIGGNAYLQRKTGCRIFTQKTETAHAVHTVLNAPALYGGHPTENLDAPIFLAESSEVCDIAEGGYPNELKIIDLKGHSIGMIGVVTPDGTAFIGDSICSEKTLSRCGIPYVYDVGNYLETLIFLETFGASAFVSAHAEMQTDIKRLVKLNREKVYEVGDRIVKTLDSPLCFDELFKKMLDSYGLKMSMEQYAMTGSVLRSYLTWLYEEKRITFEPQDNYLKWKKTDI